MQFFIASLRGSTRLSQTLSSLSQFGILPKVRFGVRGTQLSEATVSEILFSHPARDFLLRKVTPGELGCALSHYMIMNEIISSNIQTAFVLEDDAYFTRDPRPIIQAIEAWSRGRHNFLLNWGGQRDPRFLLPIATVAHRNPAPSFEILQFPEMLWSAYCLFLDRDYCIARLRKAFPLVYLYDAYGMLGLDSNFYVMHEENLTCETEAPGVSTASTIGYRTPSTLSKIFARSSMTRLRLERARDWMLRQIINGKHWPLEKTQARLDSLRLTYAPDFASDQS